MEQLVASVIRDFAATTPKRAAHVLRAGASVRPDMVPEPLQYTGKCKRRPDGSGKCPQGSQTYWRPEEGGDMEACCMRLALEGLNTAQKVNRLNSKKDELMRRWMQYAMQKVGDYNTVHTLVRGNRVKQYKFTPNTLALKIASVRAKIEKVQELLNQTVPFKMTRNDMRDMQEEIQSSAGQSRSGSVKTIVRAGASTVMGSLVQKFGTLGSIGYMAVSAIILTCCVSFCFDDAFGVKDQLKEWFRKAVELFGPLGKIAGYASSAVLVVGADYILRHALDGVVGRTNSLYQPLRLAGLAAFGASVGMPSPAAANEAQPPQLSGGGVTLANLDSAPDEDVRAAFERLGLKYNSGIGSRALPHLRKKIRKALIGEYNDRVTRENKGLPHMQVTEGWSPQFGVKPRDWTTFRHHLPVDQEGAILREGSIVSAATDMHGFKEKAYVTRVLPNGKFEVQFTQLPTRPHISTAAGKIREVSRTQIKLESEELHPSWIKTRGFDPDLVNTMSRRHIIDDLQKRGQCTWGMVCPGEVEDLRKLLKKELVKENDRRKKAGPNLHGLKSKQHFRALNEKPKNKQLKRSDLDKAKRALDREDKKRKTKRKTTPKGATKGAAKGATKRKQSEKSSRGSAWANTFWGASGYECGHYLAVAFTWFFIVPDVVDDVRGWLDGSTDEADDAALRAVMEY